VSARFDERVRGRGDADVLTYAVGGAGVATDEARAIRDHDGELHRVVGIETEYGISAPGDVTAGPTALSSRVVNAWPGVSGPGRRVPRWDYDEETPLRDARGFDLARDVADPGLLTDEDSGLANAVLTSGARLYVDHAHPEYATPEVTSPLDAVRWDKAGERVMATAAEAASTAPGGSRILLYKNNTDNKGASYGCHENYLTSRATPFAELVRHLIPFFVSRQVITGAGRVGLGQDGGRHGFQISQRADFFEVEVGLETTLKRPIVNTRDEPHADPRRFRRLHVIVGDANMCEVATYLKIGTTSLVLSMIEAGFLRDDLLPRHPVQAIHDVSHDPTLTHRVELLDGRRLTALQLQREYADAAHRFVDATLGPNADPQTLDVLARWGSVLDRLEADPMGLARELDWVAKLALLQGFRDRDGLGWDAPRLHLVDLQYHDVRPDRGLYNRLAATGRVDRLLTEDDVRAATDDPPTDTRAYFRGRAIRQFGAEVAAASWDSVIFDVPGRAALLRVPTMDPLRGSQAHVGALLDRCDTAADLVAALSGGR
jgi:proteasome accessory factor A